MSRANVETLAGKLADGALSIGDDPAPADLVALGEANGLVFSEDDLASFLRLKIAGAESLPRPWGWAVARKLGLVRS
jgi:hypothetical protein